MRDLILAARSVPVHRLPGKVVGRLAREARARASRGKVLRSPGELPDDDFRQALQAPFDSLTPEELVRHLGTRASPRFFVDSERARRAAAWLQERRPDLVDRTVAAADQLCAGRFDLLGSGPIELGLEPDWHLDFVSGYRWPLAYFKDLDYLVLDQDCDVKIPWELSRCQHFVTLGRAFALTSDKRFAAACARQLRSWLDANPWQRGVNWGSAMEVAIRAVNWLWALYLFQSAAELTVVDRWRMLKSLLQHGRYVWEQCECSGALVNGNHCLANGVGLVFLGVLLPELREAAAWRERGWRILLDELPRQVHPDGVDFEQAIGYHGLALEFYYSVVALCRVNEQPVPPEAYERLERMFEFVLAYTRPDGRFPQIGDNDDGRLQALDDEPPGSHRRHLAVGAVLFERADLLAASSGSIETAVWLLGTQALEGVLGMAAAAGQDAPSSRAFPDGGFYVMRQGGDYLMLDAGSLGMAGLGGHGHNDLLTFELCSDARAWVVDAGAYVYTRSPAERNRFRGTAAHNVVQVDGAEIARLGKGRFLWLIADDAHPRVHTWLSNDACDFFDGMHDGYERLPEPVSYRRRVLFDKRRRIFLVDDRLDGRGAHTLDLRFHLAADVAVQPDALSITLSQGQARLRVEPLLLDGLELVVEEGWVSSHYGGRQRTWVLRLRRQGLLPQCFRTAFVPLGDPAGWQETRRAELQAATALLDELIGGSTREQSPPRNAPGLGG